MIARVRNGYEKFLEAVVILLMAVLAIEVTVGVIFRSIGHSLVWYDEIASILLAWLTFYGSALAAAKRAHIGCPEVVAMLPPDARVVLRLIAEVLVIAFFVLVAWVGWSVMDVLATDHLVSLPDVPVHYVQSVLPISAILIIAAELFTLPQVLVAARRERPSGDAAEAAAKEVTY
jgi:TRAP-type C4-dicarboxylate transport system permease small subunit